MVFFDEFWFLDRPSLFYGWAEINTRCRVPSYETGRKARYGLLAVDATDGREFLQFVEKIYSDVIADYLFDVACHAHETGHTKLTVIIDNNGIHKDKMRYRLWLRLREKYQIEEFRIHFIDTPRYSPELNLAEYIIHQLRLLFLHHMPSRPKMNILCQQMLARISEKSLQTKEQIEATIQHILKLAAGTIVK